MSLFLQSRVQTSVFPWIREQRLLQLVQHNRASRSVDPKEFWQLRDEFGSGTFVLQPDHTIYRETQEIVVSPMVGPQNLIVDLASYSGKLVSGKDYLVAWWPTEQEPQNFSGILDVIAEANVPADRKVFEDEDTRAYMKDDNHLVVAFVKPLSEMATAHGLYDWTTEKLRALKGYHFATVTSFTLDCGNSCAKQFAESFIDNPR